MKRYLILEVFLDKAKPRQLVRIVEGYRAAREEVKKLNRWHFQSKWYVMEEAVA